MKKLNFKLLVLMVLSFCFISILYAKNEAAVVVDNQIAWTNIEQAIPQNKISKKKFILINLYTDWCGWCKKMEENTYQDAGIIALMNENFTAAKFNAETTAPINFNGKTYNFVKTGARGANQLALDFGSVGNKLGYPTIVVLDENGNKLQAFPGFKDVETLSIVLNYFKSGSYKTMDFQQYQSGQ